MNIVEILKNGKKVFVGNATEAHKFLGKYSSFIYLLKRGVIRLPYGFEYEIYLNGEKIGRPARPFQGDVYKQPVQKGQTFSIHGKQFIVSKVSEKDDKFYYRVSCPETREVKTFESDSKILLESLARRVRRWLK